MRLFQARQCQHYAANSLALEGHRIAELQDGLARAVAGAAQNRATED
jgi:hypothetical protein